MKKLNVLVDTNIFLDVFLEREGFYENSKAVLQLCESHDVNGFLTASSITDIFYILRKGLHDNNKAYECLGAVLDIVRIISVTDNDIVLAYSQKASDFEDCLLATCAESFGCDAIITRNKKDFEGFKIETLTPQELLQRIS